MKTIDDTVNNFYFLKNHLIQIRIRCIKTRSHLPTSYILHTYTQKYVRVDEVKCFQRGKKCNEMVLRQGKVKQGKERIKLISIILDLVVIIIDIIYCCIERLMNERLNELYISFIIWIHTHTRISLQLMLTRRRTGQQQVRTRVAIEWDSGWCMMFLWTFRHLRYVVEQQ